MFTKGRNTTTNAHRPRAILDSRMSAEIQPHAAAKARILVVDDSRVIRKAISKILGDECVLSEAEDGGVGWGRLREDDTIQVVIADVEMPRLDGYSLICRIR